MAGSICLGLGVNSLQTHKTAHQQTGREIEKLAHWESEVETRSRNRCEAMFFCAQCVVVVLLLELMSKVLIASQ